MSKHPNLADAITLASGTARIVGAVNLDKSWGSSAFAVGFTLDGVDGFVASLLGLSDDYGAALDTHTDRLSEAIVVYSLINEGIIPLELPVIGYALKSVLKNSQRDGSTIGKASTVIKDVAIGSALVATRFENDSNKRDFFRKTAVVLGWTAIALGASELIRKG